MEGEAAAEICTVIAQQVRSIRAGDIPASGELGYLIERLCQAPASNAVDALALIAIARRVLNVTLSDLSPQEIEQPDKCAVAVANVFELLNNAVQALELHTGYSAEGFTGEADAIN